MTTPSSPAPSRRRRRRRIALVAAALFALLFSWRPCHPELLFQAIPDDVFLASHHRGVSSEWHALARHPMVISALRAAGVEDAEELAEEDGFQQTLFWLTGPRTVLGFSLDDGGSPLSLLAVEDGEEALGRLRLTGASYVGWKRRPMEFLWRIRYVPGLGPLHVTENGTRYLVFRHSKTMKRLGLVLSLDMYEGNLVAALSTDPNAVNALTARLRAGAPLASIFPEAPWQCPDPDAKHDLFLRVPSLAEITEAVANPLAPGAAAEKVRTTRLQIGSFRDRSSLAFAAQLPFDAPAPAGPPPDLGPLPQDAEFARVAVCGELLRLVPGLADPAGPTPGGAVACLYGEPFPSTLCGFQIPGLLAVASAAGLRTEAWLTELLESVSDKPGHRPVLLEASDGVRRVNLKPLFGKHSPIRPHTEESPFLIAPAAPGGVCVAGTCLASYTALRAAGIPPAPPSRADGPGVLATGELDLPRVASSLGSINALLRLAAGFVSDLASLRPMLDDVATALKTVSTLGTLNFRVEAGEPAQLAASFTATEPAP